MIQKRIPKVSDVVVVFVGMAVVFAALTILAQWLYASNPWVYTVLVSLGAAIFGAGLAFFLVEMAELERGRRILASRVSVFIGLALVFVVLVLVAQNLFANNPGAHTLFVSVGAATFGGGLTYFLIDMFGHTIVK